MKKRLPVILLSSLFALSSLTGCGSEEVTNLKSDVQTQINNLVIEINKLDEQISSLKDEMTITIETTKEEFKVEIDSLSVEISSLKEELLELKNKHDQDKASIEEDYNSKLTSLENTLNSNVTTLQNNIDASNSLISELTSKHDKDIASVTKDYNEKLAALSDADVLAREALKKELSNAIDAIDKELEEQVAAIQASINSNAQAISELTTKHNNEILALTNEYHAKVEELENADKDNKDALELELNTQIEALDAAFAVEIAALSEDVDANKEAIDALTNKHNEDVSNLIEEYNQKIADLEEADLVNKAALEKELEDAIASLTASFNEELATLTANINANTNAISNLTSKHAEDILELTNNYEKAIADQAVIDANARATLKEELEASITSLNQTFSISIEALQASITANTNALNTFLTQYAADKEAITDDYNQKIVTLTNNYQNSVSSINQQIASLQSQITTLTNNMNAQITEIQNDYTSQINALTGRVATLENVEYHTVSFEVLGGYEVEIPSQIVKHGEKATRPYLPEDPGYSYNTYWYIVDDYDYIEPWLFKSAAVTEDISLYTFISPYSYEITLNDNYPGSEDYTKDGLVYSGQNFTCPPPERSGYSFAGWYYNETKVTDSSGNSLAPFNFADNITLLAKWESEHDGLSPETAYTIDELLSIIRTYTVGQWSTSEYYVSGRFSTGTTYNSNHSSFSGFAVGYEEGSAAPFQVYSAALASDIENIYGENGCLDNAEFIVRGYATLYENSAGTVRKYEIAYEKNRSTPVIVYLNGATPKEDIVPSLVLVSQALEIISELGQNEEAPGLYTVYGYIASFEEQYNSEHGNTTFSMGDSEYDTLLLRVFRATCTQEFASQLSVGTMVKVTCKLQKYYKDGESIPETKNVSKIEII